MQQGLKILHCNQLISKKLTNLISHQSTIAIIGDIKLTQQIEIRTFTGIFKLVKFRLFYSF